MHGVHSEVNVDVEFKFLAYDVVLAHGGGHETGPGNEEVLAFAKVEGLYTVAAESLTFNM